MIFLEIYIFCPGNMAIVAITGTRIGTIEIFLWNSV
jgi:hypothetical protein